VSDAELLRNLRAIRSGIDENIRILEQRLGVPPTPTDIPAWARLKVASGIQEQRAAPAASPPSQDSQPPCCPGCGGPFIFLSGANFCMKCQK
jgi:hypothetical protein